MDVHVEFKLASKWQAGELFKCFYPAVSASEPEENLLLLDESAEPPELVDSALAPPLMDDQSDDTCTVTSSLGSDTTTTANSTHASSIEPGSTMSSKEATTSRVDVSGPPQPPKLSQKKLTALAANFAHAIPDREFSMASVQGHLMKYKTRPEDAVDDAPDWVARERAAQTERDGTQRVQEKEVGLEEKTEKT
jgi:chaperone BCS1